MREEQVEKVTGLIQRGGTYSLRRKVPVDLVEALGRKEIVKALGTGNRKEAAERARRVTADLDREWRGHREALKRGEQISTKNTVTDGELQRVVLQDFWKSERSAPPLVSEEARESIEAEIGGLQARNPSTEASLLARAKAIIQDNGLNIVLPTGRKFGDPMQHFEASPDLTKLLGLVRRAGIEHLERVLDRANGDHGDKEHDPLFAGISSVSPPPSVATGCTLGEAIKRFETDPTRAHLGDTADAKYVMTFRVMKEVIGEGRALAAITRAECAEAQEVIAGLPANVSKLKPYAKLKTMRAVVELAAQRGDRLMSQGTVRVYTHTMSAFFNWAIKKGLVTINPATKMAPAKGAADVSRRPFTIEEMNKIVSALPKWSKDKSLSGRYWVPIIAIFSGMRLGEIVSLTTDQIAVRDGVDCFILRKTEDTSLKTPGAERVIPVHPELVRLGLLQHVAKMKERKVSRLFPDLQGETQAELSDLFQKRFSYLLKSTLKIDERGVSFHSFRHGFRDALREAGVPIDATRALGGWARSGGVEERYGQGTRPSTLARWMAKVSYSDLVT